MRSDFAGFTLQKPCNINTNYHFVVFLTLPNRPLYFNIILSKIEIKLIMNDKALIHAEKMCCALCELNFQTVDSLPLWTCLFIYYVRSFNQNIVSNFSKDVCVHRTHSCNVCFLLSFNSNLLLLLQFSVSPKMLQIKSTLKQIFCLSGANLELGPLCFYCGIISLEPVVTINIQFVTCKL